jgi:hypothetical protein
VAWCEYNFKNFAAGCVHQGNAYAALQFPSHLVDARTVCVVLRQLRSTRLCARDVAKQRGELTQVEQQSVVCCKSVCICSSNGVNFQSGSNYMFLYVDQ